MYSIRRESYNDTRNYNRQIIKTKFYNNHLKSGDRLPVYRATCTFEKSLSRTRKDDSSDIFRCSTLISTCVPDVYSPGSTSSGNCSPPPPSSNLPLPPFEWFH